MSSAEFLRRWDAMPDLRHAELIDGVVFMASPVLDPHSSVHGQLCYWAGHYCAHTPGCDFGIESSWKMSDKSVPQPDVHLRILPEWGGQSRLASNLNTGAPELIVEISGSSTSRDVGVKRALYERSGVCEYLTVLLYPRTVVWRHLTRGCYRDLQPDDDGVIRSKTFPGLWLDPKAVWNRTAVKALERGLRSPEHAEFVKKLARRHKAGR